MDPRYPEQQQPKWPENSEPTSPYQQPTPDSNWQQSPPYTSPPTNQPSTYEPYAQPPQPQYNNYHQPPNSSPSPSLHDDMDNPRYKHLNLSKGERVLKEVHRHPIGLIQIYAITAVVLIGLVAGATLLIRSLNSQADVITGTQVVVPPWVIIAVAAALSLLSVAIAAVAIRVYQGNKLYITNESVIQKIQVSLFAAKEQTISLGNIEDASYERQGILQHLLNYGRVRLSTEGEHTYYDFQLAPDPKEVAHIITNAQETFIRQYPDRHN